MAAGAGAGHGAAFGSGACAVSASADAGRKASAARRPARRKILRLEIIFFVSPIEWALFSRLLSKKCWFSGGAAPKRSISESAGISDALSRRREARLPLPRHEPPHIGGSSRAGRERRRARRPIRKP